MMTALKKRSEYVKTSRSGQRWVSGSVVIEVIENSFDHHRLGVTATKKIGSAVIRNRAKRRLRHIMADIETSYLNACEKRYDIVTVARQDTAEVAYETLRKDILWCLKRLGVGAA